MCPRSPRQAAKRGNRIIHQISALTVALPYRLVHEWARQGQRPPQLANGSSIGEPNSKVALPQCEAQSSWVARLGPSDVPPASHRVLLEWPQRQTASTPKTWFVLRPIFHPELHLVS